MRRTVEVNKLFSLDIGYVGENNATEVAFDFTSWAEEYGSGSPVLRFKRNLDEEAYPVALDVEEDNLAVWTVSNTDLLYKGQAEGQLQFVVDDVVKKSRIFSVMVSDSLIPTEDAPDPYDDWMDDFIRLADSASESATEAQGYASSASASAEEAREYADQTERSIPSHVRLAIYTLLENAAYETTGLTDDIEVVQSWAEEVQSLVLSDTELELEEDTPQAITAVTIPYGATVSWTTSNPLVATVVNGIVTGVLNGSCTITASAGDLSATCDVTVSGFAEPVSISAVYTQSGTVYDADSLDSLKADLVVTATYDDSSTEVITAYILSGTLEAGTSTITVYYRGKTTTFSVTVTAWPEGYQRVEYLFANQSSHLNGAYIDTGVAFNNPTTAVYKVGVQADSMTSWTSTADIIGTRQTGTGTTNNVGFELSISSNKIAWQAWSSIYSAWIPENTSVLYDYHDIVATWKSNELSIKIDDMDTITSSGSTRGCSGYHIGLFGNPSNKSNPYGADYLMKGKLYYAEIEQDGTPIFKGIPCYRISDNVVGMYDFVNSTFRTAGRAGASGSADLITAGPEV